MNPVAVPGAMLFPLFFPSSLLPGALFSVRGSSFLNGCQMLAQVAEVKEQQGLESSQALVGSEMVDLNLGWGLEDNTQYI